jgi:hypothetical protein
VTLVRLPSYCRGDTVRREYDEAAVRDGVEFFDEDRAAALEIVDDMPIVDNLTTYVDRRPEPLQGLLHRVDRPLDTGTERPGRRQQQVPLPNSARPGINRRRSTPQLYKRPYSPSRHPDPPQRPPGRVNHHPHNHGLPVIPRQQSGLGVNGNRPSCRQCSPLANRVDYLICSDNRSDMNRHPQPPQLPRNKLSAKTRHNPISVTNLARHDDVAWSDPIDQRAGNTGYQGRPAGGRSS